jgi:hypothetical protein
MHLPDLAEQLADTHRSLYGDTGADAMKHLLDQVGREVAGPLTSALERVNALASGGQPDRNTLQALREEIECARRAGKLGQQLARFATGRIKPRPESCSLTALLRDALQQRQRELQARGITLRPSLESAELLADPSLLFTLLQALLDWCAEHARSAVDLRLALQGWPTQACLTVRFVHTPAGDLPRTNLDLRLDTLSWQLASQCAQMLGLRMERLEEGIETQATVLFPNTLMSALGDGDELPDSVASTTTPNSQPLAGTHVLAVAARREVRQQLREALQHMGLVIDFVPSLAEAQQFCRGGLPHAVVYEGALGGQRFDAFRESLQRELPQLVFVEVSEEGQHVDMAQPGRPVARLGRPVLAQALPSVLVFELSRTA